MLQIRDLQIPATDGFQLAATLFEPHTPRHEATVLINPATAVKRSYYARYATFLAERGLRTVTFDYRGVGGSRPERLRRFEAAMHHWAERDTEGVLRWIESRPAGRTLLVGHSFGGQGLGMIAGASRLGGALLVAAQSGYWGHWPGLWRAGMLAAWYGLLPALTTLCGYFPARRLGIAEDLPAGVAREWAQWGRQRQYILARPKESWRRGYASLDLPILALSFGDDRYAPKAAVEALLGFYPQADVVRRHVEPGDYGVRRIGHFGFFRDTFRDTLWEESFRWLEERLEPARTSAPRRD